MSVSVIEAVNPECLVAPSFTMKFWDEAVSKRAVSNQPVSVGKYKTLRTRSKIWEMMYESFPGMVLQLYAAMTTNVPVEALLVSIFVSAVTVSVTVIQYLLRLSTMKRNSTETDFSILKAQKSLIFPFFTFVLSDFVLRSLPLVIFLAVCHLLMSGDAVTWYLFCNIFFSACLLFEFVANFKIRVGSHRNCFFILKVFAVSVFSSFYSLLCCFELLEHDALFALSVDFAKFKMVHRLREGMSFILSLLVVVSVVVFADDFDDRLTSIAIASLAVYAVSWIGNETALFFIDSELTAISSQKASLGIGSTAMARVWCYLSISCALTHCDVKPKFPVL